MSIVQIFPRSAIIISMNNKVMIVGTGNVGASIAFSIINQRTPVNEVVLVDHDTDDAVGEAMDLNNALAVAPSFIKISAGNYANAKDCDIVVIAAGAPQEPDETRLDLLAKNANVIKEIVPQIMESGFDGIFLVVTNPMDVLTYLVWKISGLPSEKVIGSGTVLDSARLRSRIASYLNVNAKSVHAYQVGEHGDSELTIWSSANVGGQLISELLPRQTLADIEEFVRQEAYEIIERKRATYYGIGICTTHIINCILNDERRILPVSSYDDSAGVYNGFPAVLGRNGVVRRVELQINEKESIKLQKSINALKSAINSLP